MVVLDDADPATVAEAIKIGGYFNSGQDCTASSRILVAERIYDDVLSATVKAVEGMKVGDPATDDEIGMGPVISARAAGARARLPRARDRREGDDRHGRRRRSATAASSSRRRSSPTSRRTPRSCRTRCSGPVVTLQRFASDDEAIAMANDVRYGLAASVFSENVGRAMKVAAGSTSAPSG